MELMKKFVSEESGQGMVEYGMIIALVSVVALMSLVGLGTNTDSAFKKILEQMQAALK